ncbi:MAG: dienelactone hydrolase family protein [Candidatus Flexifilum sp.]|jgi:carboxymethylenebutenolidase
MQVTIPSSAGPLSTYVAVPDGPGPWPGVVVIHDALGMTPDLQRQTDWLASAGYLAAAPDLFDGGTMFRCLLTIFRDYRRRSGPLFDRVEAVRQWLLAHDRTTDRVGLIGFCFGGGFALLLVPTGGYAAASVNYGMLPADIEAIAQRSCPIVASFGAQDRSLKGAAARLEAALTAAGVDHDVKTYPDAGHGFLNDLSDARFPPLFTLLGVVIGTTGGYHPESAEDARGRILRFFDRHLRTSPV